jgi:hypothetical protein
MRWGDLQPEARKFPGEESYTSANPNSRCPSNASYASELPIFFIPKKDKGITMA